MIVTGGFRSHVLTQAAPELTCSACRCQGKVDLHVSSECVHLFLIPFFPVGKIGYASCQQCEARLNEYEMSVEMKRAFSQAKSVARTPWWQFSGVAMVAMLPISLPLISSIAGDREDTPIPASYSAGFGEHSSREIVEYEGTDEYKKNDNVPDDESGAKGID